MALFVFLRLWLSWLSLKKVRVVVALVWFKWLALTDFWFSLILLWMVNMVIWFVIIKRGKLLTLPNEYKVLMITNTNIIYAWVCCLNRLPNIVWNTLQNAWLILFKNRSSREDDSRISNSPGIRTTECLQQQIVFLQDVRLIQQESWFDIGFIFLDFC